MKNKKIDFTEDEEMAIIEAISTSDWADEIHLQIADKIDDHESLSAQDITELAKNIIPQMENLKKYHITRKQLMEKLK